MDNERELNEYILNRFKVSPHKLPYYLKWIQKYKRFVETNGDIDYAQEEFLKKLGPQYRDWQIEQAEKAVTIYLSFIGKQKRSGRENIIEDASWDNVVFRMRNEIRLQNKSLQTEQSYLHWIKKFGVYLANKKPILIDQNDVKTYLTYLAIERNVSISTQKQAFNAILFLFRHVLDRKIDNLDSVARSKARKRLPIVLSRVEIVTILSNLQNPYKLMAELIYGGGLRLTECLKLRIKDIDFQNKILTVRSGKGDKDRQTLLSEKCLAPLKQHIQKIKKYYDDDRLENRPGVELPKALERKYPNAGNLYPCRKPQ